MGKIVEVGTIVTFVNRKNLDTYHLDSKIPIYIEGRHTMSLSQLCNSGIFITVTHIDINSDIPEQTVIQFETKVSKPYYYRMYFKDFVEFMALDAKFTKLKII